MRLQKIVIAACIDAGLMSQEDLSLVIDHNKIRRTKQKLIHVVFGRQEK